MISARWRKAWRDVAERPLRTALAVLAMTAGVAGLGAILSSRAILARELPRTFADTHPASAILAVEEASDDLVASVRRLPEVSDAEARLWIRGRIRVGEDEWAPLVLFVVRDFRDLRVDTFTPEAGAWPPGDGEVLLERTALPVARASIGEAVVVRAAGGADRSLKVAGTVHAAGLAPAWMDHVVSGFVDWRSALRAEPQAVSAEIRIVAAGDRLDERHVREVAGRVQGFIEAQGGRVTRVEIPAPGRHPHADQMDTFLVLLGAYGALASILGAVLVANLIHALLAEQVRQVGAMKALGASTGQVVAVYLGQVFLLAALSLVAGVPLGLEGGRAYARFAATMLNASLASLAVPAWIFAVQAAVGLALPLVVAAGPVHWASRITIHEALRDGAGRASFGSSRLDRWLARLEVVPRPLILSLRTAFNRRGRLALTVGTLAAGGAVFISALNVREAWGRAIADDARARRYDIDVRLSRPYATDRIARAVASVPEAARAECWAETGAAVIEAGGEAGPRVALVGPDEGSDLLRLPLLEGRWLEPGDEAAAVVNQALCARDPEIHVGGRITLRVGERDLSWPVVGIVKELHPGMIAYAPSHAVLEAMGTTGGTARSVRIVTQEHDPPSQLAAQRALERALESAGIGVLDIQRLSDRRKAFEDHLVIVYSALILAAALVVLVGGLGLTTTLSLNVLERTREIGILGAIGATPGRIAGFVVIEGVLTGALSWALAILASIPITVALDRVTGLIFIKSPIDFAMGPQAAGIWLALVLVLSSLGSLHPARRAARLTVREALAYE